MSRRLDAWTRRQIISTPLHVLLETHRTYTRSDLRASLAALTLPALVIQGSTDKSAPIEVTGRPTAALIPNSSLVSIDNAGHGVYASRAQRYNQELARFAAALTDTR